MLHGLSILLYPLPAAVSSTAESPGYITKSEPEIEPEENDGDDEKYEGDSIDYLTSEGDNDANDDGDDLSEDDANEEDEEQSSDSEEEEEEHLALTVPAPAQYSSVSESDETEPFEEGETAATPPPFGYRIAARISVQPHILMPFRTESETDDILIQLFKANNLPQCRGLKIFSTVEVSNLSNYFLTFLFYRQLLVEGSLDCNGFNYSCFVILDYEP
nr:hypothetical protein [Tanacetum cinerariifolium]